MFKEGKLCSTKCNGMFNSSCNIIDHTPLSMPGFSDFEQCLQLTVACEQ